MSDSIDNPSFSNVENIGTFSFEDAFFMVFESTPEGSTKVEAKCIPAASLQAVFAPAHPELSVTFADNVPAFNGDNQTLRLPNAPRLNLTTPANGRTYTFTSGDGQQTQAVFIPSQEDLTHEPAEGQIFRWRFTKQSATPDGEATSIVIEVPVIVDPSVLFHPSPIVRGQTNGKVPKYEAGGKLGAYAFYSVESDESVATRTEYAAGRSVWSYTSLDDVVIINYLNLSSGSADGTYIVYDPLMTTTNTSMIRALTTDNNGAVIPELDSDQRDELALTKFNRLIFNTDTDKLNYHNGTVWRELNYTPI